MKKFVISIEETCVREFEVFAENDNDAIKTAEEKYHRGEFVLEPGECQFRQMKIVSPQNDEYEWIEF